MVSASVLILFGILRTGTRGAWLSVGLLVVWLVVSRVARHRRVLPALYVAIAAACIATVTGQFDRFVVPYLDRSLRDTGDLNGRLYMWPFARDLLTDHLVFGAGAGTFRAVNPLGISAHNALLEIGSGLGLLGIALFLGVAVRALVKETAMTDEVSRNRKLGAFLIVSTPILLSGVWEQSAVAWVAMALASRMAMSPGAAPKEQVQSPRERQPPRHPPQTTVSEPPGVRGLRSPQSLHSGT
jgi:O-antigen ligase